MSTETHTCPRRAEDGTDTTDSPFAFAGPNQDTYTEGHGLKGQARGCSYCGSMHPDDFMEAARTGMELSPTDKSYKIYVEAPTSKGKFYFQHLSDEQRREFVDLVNARTIHLGYPGHFTRLPYFMARA